MINVVVSREEPFMEYNYKEYNVNAYGAISDGNTICTASIQNAIDDAHKNGGGFVTFLPGVYLTGAIFLKSNVELVLDEGVELRGVQDENAYPDIWSRVAGIEMEWPSALITIYEQSNCRVTGKGLINGQGEFWWEKYWGIDGKGGMRKPYTEKGLRWVVDYDCKRPRNILVYKSDNIVLEGVTVIRSPFWNVHVCYSDRVTVRGLHIKENQGPSTDGIDVDSSSNVIVEDCHIDCNDDNICIKCGRDADGLRVNRPTEHVIVRNCTLGRGAGITIGSETSGGVRNVEIYNITSNGTDAGLRFKSASTRGGLIENIKVYNMELNKVPNPFSFQLNWYPSYSYASLPEDFIGEVPPHWKALAEPVIPKEKGIPEFRNIEIYNITAKSIVEPWETELARIKSSKAFDVEAYEEKPISNIHFSNIYIETNTAGSIKNAKDWTMEDVTLCTVEEEPLQVENTDKIQLPKWIIRHPSI